MKILFVTGRYLPEKNGGIENYTHWLAKLLLADGHSVHVAILDNRSMDDFDFEGVAIKPMVNLFDSFRALLLKEKYDIAHFQEYSMNGISHHWFEEAKSKVRKLYFTFHLPYLTCYKNDFRYFGTTDCNHFTSPERCQQCIIADRLNYKKETTLSLRNMAIRVAMPLLQITPKGSSLKTRIKEFNHELDILLNLCDNIFIYGKWFMELLNANGYNSPVLKMIPHITKPAVAVKSPASHEIKNKIVFVGRIEKQKGLHLLVQAMNKIKTPGLQLDVFGNIVDQHYFEKCKNEFDFNFIGSLPRQDLLARLANYDFLVLPSVFTEMSSLVLQEAFYEAVPVIVSSAKGNRDVVSEGVNGFVFDYDDAEDLAKKIDKAFNLKSNGWQPVFEARNPIQTDTEYMLSFYR